MRTMGPTKAVATSIACAHEAYVRCAHELAHIVAYGRAWLRAGACDTYAGCVYVRE